MGAWNAWKRRGDFTRNAACVVELGSKLVVVTPHIEKDEETVWQKVRELDQFQNIFPAIEEASDFWDTHDAGDYEEYLRPVCEGIDVVKELPQAVLLEPSHWRGSKELPDRREFLWKRW